MTETTQEVHNQETEPTCPSLLDCLEMNIIIFTPYLTFLRTLQLELNATNTSFSVLDHSQKTKGKKAILS